MDKPCCPFRLLKYFCANRSCMFTTIKGTYSNGQILLLEPPPTNEPTEVLVTFTKNASVEEKVKQPVFGFSKGIVVYMAPDFDAPLLEEFKDYM